MKYKLIVCTFITLAIYSDTFAEDRFALAMPNEIWEIKEDNISVLRKPETTSDKTEYLLNLVTVLKDGTRVGILESEGWLIVWKKVLVFNDKGETYAAGWILAETVKSAVDVTYKYK